MFHSSAAPGWLHLEEPVLGDVSQRRLFYGGAVPDGMGCTGLEEPVLDDSQPSAACFTGAASRVSNVRNSASTMAVAPQTLCSSFTA